MPVLTILIALPFVGAAIIGLLPRRRPEVVFPVAIGVSVAPLAVAIYLLAEYSLDGTTFQFFENYVLSERFGIAWELAIDGISLFMVVLTAVLFPLAIAASASVRDKLKTYMILMLVLEGAVLGVFLALDLLVFFAFFEIVLIPMYLLISMWGSDRRAYAALKFVVFTAIGSAFLLVGIIVLGILAGDAVGATSSFDWRVMLSMDISESTQMWLFAGFGIAFAIKVPLFPFHTWLPDAHTEAPTAGSVILAGVLLKMGAYGLLRFNLSLFPDASVDLAPVLAVLGVIGIIYGAAAAIVQPDIKRLVAYSSVSHMGFIILGIFAFTSQSLQGSVFQMISHGLTTGALFLLIGMIYDRTHTRAISDYGGLAKQMPVYAGIFLFSAFASAGLPGLSGFVGEFTILVGSYLTLPVLTIIAGLGVILAAVYLLWAYERVFTGPLNPKLEGLKDLSFRELAIMVPLVVLIIGLGVYPKPVMDRIQPSVEQIIDRLEGASDYQVPEFGRLTDVESVVGVGHEGGGG
ncbi:MAG: NADH-quinone oxidoreductase subunit M [Actinomycetota bacterium]|nr:NADH-quinone oxidoreductase subunit M [Actinomycetota bacterium]